MAPPSQSFLKDYRKNMQLKFGKEMSLKFKRRPSFNQNDMAEVLSD